MARPEARQACPPARQATRSTGSSGSTVAAGGSGAFLGPGVVDTVQLAAKFGLSALPSTYPGGGGTNYANGSAQTVPTTADDGYTHGLYNNVPIVTQIYNYLGAVHNAADPNALYMISYGGNDLIWLQNQAPPALSAAALHPVAGNRPDRQHRSPAGRRRAHHRGARMSTPTRSWSGRAEP